MQKTVLFFVLSFLSSIVFSDCNVYKFRWGCDLSAKERPKKTDHFLVYCRSVPVYVSRAEYEQLMRYRRLEINMDLMIDGVFVKGPCVPGRYLEAIEVSTRGK